MILLNHMDKFNKILEEDAILISKRVNLEELLGKQLIITGASGLIGINFLMSLKEFSRKNKKQKLPQITAIFYNDVPKYFKEILNFENLTIKIGDITDQGFVDSFPEGDYIIHAAGYGQPGKFMQDKIKTIAINTAATLYLLKKLKAGGKFLFLSTSEVYSGLSNPPFRENQIGTTNTTHPRACYIEGKRCCEAICNIYFEKGILARSARLSLAYGPGTKPGDMRVLNSFIEKGLTGKIEMMDQGEAKRTYCYVSDAVEMMWNILLFGRQPVYNVGGFSDVTIAGLANKIGKLLNAEVVTPTNEGEEGTEVSRPNVPPHDRKIIGAPDDVRLDMSLAAEEFKKRKNDYVSLDEGLKKTIEWQKELYKIK
ncbi:hypothetical protein A3A09_02995 [Candidatus Nomurabacteria bacterium RIFCSPLOWO2_01_FULL_42_20]|uniref:NAD-dependent epimerase/dehydratase domain-containing protein n=1 Tax=Candidatus Nomurabacteria bacterium RIFCSPHIGHO2_01_FULL_42_16 TaxID=1801743 RepID=A0A1F6VJE2_9BACT|nr:MAG: hypothetical protein A2824_03095 [Candidatus Nomurabacteria bacterium RIFCSPHIGHO2_01_FULL_42_16]OGI92573.1 MAG: hypothetical protein A3A09_02995 [Candidatus Nomurabacteria bacterium RIFCSPLOWO2_01_FULL_42_20]